jgi:copper chaperone CopZ
MTTRLRVTGMTYESHEDIVEKALRMADGVVSASADGDENIAIVEGDAPVEVLVEKVRMAGYDAEPIE